jgi:hypothetical protein
MKNQNNNLISKLAFMFFVILPTVVSLFLAYQVRTMSDHSHGPVEQEPQIVCFAVDVCAIEVLGKWYHIDGVINMEDTIPPEYRINDLIEEAVDKRTTDIESKELERNHGR